MHDKIPAQEFCDHVAQGCAGKKAQRIVNGAVERAEGRSAQHQRTRWQAKDAEGDVKSDQHQGGPPDSPQLMYE